MVLIKPIMIILISFVIVLISELIKERSYDINRAAIKRERVLSDIPYFAADYLKDILFKDKQSDEYKLAVLVVEDANGNKSIEDIDLRGDSADNVSLSVFKNKKNTWNVDKFFTDYNIIQSLSLKLNNEVCDTDRYYAFQITKENILGGRHGKDKKKIVKDYVQFFNLSEYQLRQIANLSC